MTKPQRCLLKCWLHNSVKRRRQCIRRLQQAAFSFRWSSSSSSTTPSSLTTPTENDATTFLEIMNHRRGSVVTDPDILKVHNVDWTGKFEGQSQILLQPTTTEEVSLILKYCNDRKIGVVPQGGNTGLVGGSVPTSNKEVILSVKRMNRIESISSENGTLLCEAGCILQDLQSYAAAQRHLVPLDVGSKGSCCIGGNVSTNAGGQYFYRYGSLHSNVLGLQVVLPNGSVLDTMQTVNLKDNTGYDLKHLFIGAEGTLGVITKVALVCPTSPQARNAAFVACNSYHDVLQTLRLAKDMLGEILAAFEYMDEAVLDIVFQQKQIPVCIDATGNYPYCILVETHGSNHDHDAAKMEAFLETAISQEVIADGILAQDLRQLNEIWEIRESCNPIVASQGSVYKYDLSVPVTEFDDLVSEVRERLRDGSGTGPDAIVVNWGHVIDGNIHLNVLTPGVFEPNPVIVSHLEPFIFETVRRRGGSISAEHGLGQCKNRYLPMCKDSTTLDTMRSLKHLFDPNGIMNPGKYLP